METLLQWGQLLGALVVAAGAAACNLDRIESTPMLMIVGIVLYCGCWIGALVWPRDKVSRERHSAMSDVSQSPTD